MDKKYAFILLVFFVAIIAVSGCTGQTKTQQITKQAAFVGGTDGLKVSLLPGQPPSQVYSGQDFQIAVQIENKGEGNLTNMRTGAATAEYYYGYVSLSGISTDSFNITTPTQPITSNLLPVKKIGTSVVPGGMAQITFKAKAPAIAGAQAQFPLYVSTLYPYASRAVAAACVKQNIYQQAVSGKEICTITGAKTVEASGAPVKVTSVEELPTGFNIKVKNVGGGYAFRYSSTAFPQNESAINPFSDKDRVMIRDVKLGGDSIKGGCSLQELFLINNEAQFFCGTGKIGSAKAEAVEQLVIDLDYGYVSTASTTLVVQSTG